MSLEQSDAEAGAVAVARRVTLADINAAIEAEYYTTGDRMAPTDAPFSQKHAAALGLMTVCTLVMRNGFVVLGTSACASPENFNAELGKRFAREVAVKKVWELMGYCLKDGLFRHRPAL